MRMRSDKEIYRSKRFHLQGQIVRKTGKVTREMPWK